MVDGQRFWRDGFLVLPKLLDPQLVARWRQVALQRKDRLADLMSDEALRDVVLDENLIAVARELLGAQPVYFGDSTATIGGNLWGFHKDNSDRLDAKAPDWTTDRYPIIRFGIYAQPHGEEPGGIEFRRGSHLFPDVTSGQRFAAPSELGDVIVWNSRTTHSGNSRIMRGLGVRPMPDAGRHVSRILHWKGLDWLWRRQKHERVAMFVSYAKEHPLLERHLVYLRSRAYPWDIWGASHWTEEAKGLAARRGLALIDPTQFRPDDSPRNKEYAPIPY